MALYNICIFSSFDAVLLMFCDYFRRSTLLTQQNIKDVCRNPTVGWMTPSLFSESLRVA